MPGLRDTIDLPGGQHACLMLHGLASSPLEVRYVGKLLQRTGFSVHIPRIEGYSGGSACGEWKQWLQSAGALYRTLCSRYRTVSVAGLSAGATLALGLALEEPKPQALALWGVAIQYDGWAIPWYQWLFEPCYRLGIASGFSYRESEPYGLKNKKWRARVAHAMTLDGESAAGPAVIPSKFLFEAVQLARHVRRNLASVSSDALIIHAADDETASPRNADLVERSIRSAHKRKILLGDSYHLITMDNERELVARETIRFFQQSIMWNHPDEAFRLVSSAKAVLRLQRRRAADKRPP